MGRTVSVIMPTTCEGQRASLIHRALASVTSQTGVDIELLIVVNGDRFEPCLVAELSECQRVRLMQLEVGNVSAARLHGLRTSHGEFFCFLDDDDEFLDGALAQRVALFEAGVDVVVTNGLEHRHGSDVHLVANDIARSANEDPYGSFLRSNWFASPSAMFRASTVPAELFETHLRYFEWTHLFFALLANKATIRYFDCLTYRKYEDNPHSVSKSAEYAKEYPSFLANHLLTFDLPAKVKREIRRKYRHALNALSQESLRAGRRREAWEAHLRCIFSGGFSFLPYTRRLLGRAPADLGDL